jgi:hypothetical protein
MNVFKKSILLVLACFYAAAVSFAGQAAVFSVQVRKGSVRQTPTFLGEILFELDYGDKVKIVEEKASWAKIAAIDFAIDGWMHTSSLTDQEIELKAGVSDVETGASGRELALAGKGFDIWAEDKFKKENPAIDFSWVDKIETFKVSQQQIQAFLAEGEMLEQGAAL